MTKEIQDPTWSVLPKEFKEEVRKEYRQLLNSPWQLPGKGYLRGRLRMLRELFGEHNLASDAEGEEMLAVSRKEAQGLFNSCNMHKRKCILDGDSTDYLDGEINILTILFGTKCLSDGNSSNVERLEKNEEPKPAEPKYHKGEKVSYNGYVYEIEGLVGKSLYALKGLNFDLDEDMIEPYTELEKDPRNLSQSMSNCDKHFDNILKGSFSKERRLNVATHILSSILSNQKMLNNLASGETTAEGAVRCIVDTTMMYTDALMTKCDKGGNNGED